jgi:hypothetical protein
MYLVSFRLINSDKIIWSMELDDLELVAGLLAGTMSLLQYLREPNYHMTTDADVSMFRLIDNVVQDDIEQYSRVEVLCNKCSNDFKYAVWMPSGSEDRYSLYGFNTSKFSQGLFSICDRFNVDYRDCIYGIPFDWSGGKYTFDGYNLVSYQVAQDAPDLNDVEEEEQDNEALIDAFSVSDGDDENQFS